MINGIQINLKKIKVIINWQEPKNIKDIRAFIGFNIFYQQFINNFSTLALPLIALTRKDKAFTYLKVIFTTTLIL